MRSSFLKRRCYVKNADMDSAAPLFLQIDLVDGRFDLLVVRLQIGDLLFQLVHFAGGLQSIDDLEGNGIQPSKRNGCLRTVL